MEVGSVTIDRPEELGDCCGDAVLFSAQCGWGKTSAALAYCARDPEGSLFIVPLIALKHELERRFAQGHQPSPRVMTVDEIVRATIDWDRVSTVVIDEIHVYRPWGDSFRPTMAAALDLIPGHVRILAMSATVDDDTAALVAGLGRPIQRVWGRPADLAPPAASVLPEDPDVDRSARVVSLVRAHEHQKGIVFVPRISLVRALTAQLRSEGFSCCGYHGRLDLESRRRIESWFRDSSAGFLIATSAFSMGVHIPDVRIIVQWEPPEQAWEETQQLGRAAGSSDARFYPLGAHREPSATGCVVGDVRCLSVYGVGDVGRHVRDAKYRGGDWNAPWFMEKSAAFFQELTLLAGTSRVAVVPQFGPEGGHTRTLRKLAEAGALSLEEIPLQALLPDRPSKSLPATFRSLWSRGPRFRLTSKSGLSRGRIVLVDDILGSGATLHQAASLLESVGYEVFKVAFAATGKG